MTTNASSGTQPPIKILVFRAGVALGIREQWSRPREVQKLKGSGLAKEMNYRKYFSRREGESQC